MEKQNRPELKYGKGRFIIRFPVKRYSFDDYNEPEREQISNYDQDVLYKFEHTRCSITKAGKFSPRVHRKNYSYAEDMYYDIEQNPHASVYGWTQTMYPKKIDYLKLFHQVIEL